MDKEKEEKERLENLKMMKDPYSWFKWPVLPMKKIDSKDRDMDQFGFLFANGKPVLYLRNMWELSELGIRSVKQLNEVVPKKEYSSFDAILDDGWIVD